VPEEAAVLGQIWQLFQSEPFFLLLSNLTGLRLHSLAPEDRSGFELRISAPGYEFIARGFPGFGILIFSYASKVQIKSMNARKLLLFLYLLMTLFL
jgi:hypothetical protein